MAALVVVALFWGNCFSCPQVLLAAQKHQCCPHGKAGPHGKADPSECQTQGLRNFVKADPVESGAPALASVTVPVATFIETPLAVTSSEVLPPQFTPPDLLPLRI